MLSHEYALQLDRGLQVEQLVARYVVTRHKREVMRMEGAKSHVKQDTGAPMLLAYGAEIIAPDMLTWGNGEPLWLEVKDKDNCSWHRITSKWQTGFNERHFHAYLEVSRRTRTDVSVWFIQRGIGREDDPRGLPQPRGVYTGRLSKIGSKGRSRGGMMYWNLNDLTMQCSLEQLHAVANVTMIRR